LKEEKAAVFQRKKNETKGTSAPGKGTRKGGEDAEEGSWRERDKKKAGEGDLGPKREAERQL